MNDDILQQTGQRSIKDPWLAVLLSKVFPGAGHIYCGEKTCGLFFVVTAILLFLVDVLSVFGFLAADSSRQARTYGVGFLATSLVLFIVSVYVLFDAYKVTKRRNPDGAWTTAFPGARKPWLAAFLSSIIPGVGQFYNRQIIRGLAFLLMLIVAGVLEAIFMPLVIVNLLVYVFAVKDAYDSARKLNGSSERFFRQKKSIVWFMIVMFTLQSIPFAQIIKKNFVEAFRVPTGTMYPTIKIGDNFLLAKSRPFFTSPQRGDIVVFPYPKNPTKNFVKRVIGLGGDKIQIVHGELYLNAQMISAKKLDEKEESDGLSLNTPPTVYEESIGDAVYRVQYLRDKSSTNAGPWLVPQDSVFVMGDNRDNSQDSRIWGPVKSDTVKGKALKIYWSWDRAENKVHWERIGEIIH